MGILKNTNCYLVGNIEYTQDAYSWRTMISRELAAMGVKSLDPNKDNFINQTSENEDDRKRLKDARSRGEWAFVHDYMKKVIRRDLRMVDLSTFIVGRIEPKMPTFGTIHEIVEASKQSKPILLQTDRKDEFPLWLAGLVNMEMVFESWTEVLIYIHSIDGGSVKADPKYWKILNNES